MKPFNLEKAKAGEPVCTRDGRSVRIICFDKKDKKHPLIALIDNGNSEDVYYFSEKGKFFISIREKHENDLFMVPTKHEGWINVYPNPKTHAKFKRMTSYIFASKEEAQENAAGDMLDTIKIEWEE